MRGYPEQRGIQLYPEPCASDCSNKIEIIKRAEGQAERHYLMGVALAKSRQAMVHEMKQGAALLGGVDVRIRQPPQPQEIMNILLVAQYMDVLETKCYPSQDYSTLLFSIDFTWLCYFIINYHL